MDPTHLADGSPLLLGLHVHRCHPQDGTRRAGKQRGPRLVVTAIRDLQDGDTLKPASLAVLKRAGTHMPAGTEPVWNLRRAPGFQPKTREAKAASARSISSRGVPIHSIRLNQEFRGRLALRGDELGWVMRRDIERLYDLLDAARASMVFPAGTLEELAKAWTFAAPPPPQNTLRPQWFVPVLLDACRRLGTQTAMQLASYAETWNPIEALAVQDAVERWEPEASHATKLRSAGLQDEPPPDAPESELQARRERAGRKVKA